MEQTLQEKLLRQLHRNFHLMKAVHGKWFKKLGKKYDKPRVLEALYEHGAGAGLHDLAKLLETDGAELDAVLRKLQDKGYISISGDGKEYYITGDGERKLEKLRQGVKDLADKFLTGLSEAEQRQLYDLLEKVNANLRTQEVYGGYNYYLEDCWEPHGCVQPPPDMEKRY